MLIAVLELNIMATYGFQFRVIIIILGGEMDIKEFL